MTDEVTITFSGETLYDAMVAARTNAHAFFLAMDDVIAAQDVRTEMAKGNGEAKEDVVVSEDIPLDNSAVLHCALDLLMTVYSSDDKAAEAVNNLLEKYNVDSLNDVLPEKASELFKDAEKLATDFGVSN